MTSARNFGKNQQRTSALNPAPKQANSDSPAPGRRSAITPNINRNILALALPALGSLIAEPIFALTDTAMVGHLGASQLAGLGVASTILQTAISLMIFLAYSTTPAVARLLGAGQEKRALQAGIDGLWFAAALGAILAGLLAIVALPAIGFFLPPETGTGITSDTGNISTTHTSTGTNTTPAAHAASYLFFSLPGVPAMLMIFAATGVLRGLQDTRTPLYIALAGFTGNIALNWVFIYGCNLGVAGSALGTVVAQWAMLAAFVLVLARRARRTGASWRPSLAGFRQAGFTGGWLFLRSFWLRAVGLITLAAAAAHGAQATAVYHIMLALLMFFAFALDSLAIAAQALIGRALGADDAGLVQQILRRCVWWSLVAGLVFAAGLAASAGVLGRVFTSDGAILAALPGALLVLAAGLPVQSVVFVLDGVLMGASDARYLALSGLANLLLFLPVIAWVWASSEGRDLAAHAALVTAAYAVWYMFLRLVTLSLRARSDAWLRLGAL